MPSRRYSYLWIHLPSGKHGTKTLERDFVLRLCSVEGVKGYHQLLCRWNNAQPGVWAYAPLD